MNSEPSSPTSATATVEHDAVMLLGFGGPEGPDDVLPFLRRVTAGRNIPDERLAVVGEHYALFGGVSPINEHNRALLAELRVAMDAAGIDLPLYWGNRNWDPLVGDTMAQMANDGVEHAVVIATSAWSSYSSCRQYQENLAEACAPLGDRAPEWVKIRPFFNHPGFIAAMVDRTATALEDVVGTPHLVFTAHSIPSGMAADCDYEAQLHDAAATVIEGVQDRREGEALDWTVVYQSRSGPPQVPWLEPDVLDHIRERATVEPTHATVVVPIGFVSDHMEVLFDLDTEAAQLAEELNMEFHRVQTVGTHPAFVAGLVDLVREQLDATPPVAVGQLGPRPTPCAKGCCPAGRPRPARPPSA